MPNHLLKRGLLAGSLSLYLLVSGSLASSAGRPLQPAYMPNWSPEQQEDQHHALESLANWTFEMPAPVWPEPEQQTQTAVQAPIPASQPAAAPAAAKKEAPKPTAAVKQQAKPKSIAPANQAAASTAAAHNAEFNVAGKTYTARKQIHAVASAYTASNEENGGYGAVDYFGNPLKVGTIAVDPRQIPLGSTVYVTGYQYNGLPAGGMWAKAVDIGSAIKGNRVDIFVPDSPELAKKFGLQNVTLYVAD